MKIKTLIDYIWTALGFIKIWFFKWCLYTTKAIATMIIASMLCDSCISAKNQTVKESMRYVQKSFRVPQAHKDLHEHMLKNQIPNIVRK